MSVSSTNRERFEAGTANGNGKESAERAEVEAEGKSTSPDNFDAPPLRVSHVNRLPAERTDEELLAAYRTGDRTSFNSLVERYQRELFHFLVRFLGDRAAAEDIFQETFLQVHQSADQFDPTRRFRPWLFTIAANKGRDLMRSQARRPTNPLQASISGDDESGTFIDLMASADPMPGEAMEREELQKVVQTTVEGMPEHLREILLLSYFHQFPYKEISDILQIPLGTVKSRLHAAVAYFADRWKNRIQRTNGGPHGVGA
jgi:RNA polymerase sigma-70 factor (ECF subfamily)